LGTLHSAFADMKRSNKFGFRVHSNEDPLVANRIRIGVTANLALLLLNKSPNLVALNIPAMQITHLAVQPTRATVADYFKQSQNCVPIQSSESFGGANGAASMTHWTARIAASSVVRKVQAEMQV